VTTGWLALQALACAVAIGRAGYVLSETGDAIAEAKGWGRGWIGLALLATVTSLPELASGISAVALVDAPDLAVGNALGACMFNMGFLVVVDALQRDQPIYARAGSAHLLSAAFGVVMAGFVAISMIASPRAPALFGIGLHSPALLVLYLLALRAVHAHESAARMAASITTPAVDAGALRRLWRRFGLAAAVVLAAGAWLPGVAEQLASGLGIDRSVVGTLLMALVTTLPEMAVTLGALRLGALDLAIGTLLGSSLFNIAILSIDDFFYRRGPLLADASPAHLGTAVGVAVMAGLVIVGLVMRPRGRLLRVTSWVSVGLVTVWLLNAVLLGVAAR